MLAVVSHDLGQPSGSISSVGTENGKTLQLYFSDFLALYEKGQPEDRLAREYRSCDGLSTVFFEIFFDLKGGHAA
jgi:hypothetical protein